MARYEATIRVREHYERLQAEREFILQFLDISCGGDNFREAFSAYISRNEETTNRLTEKTKRLKTQLLNAKTEQEISDNQLSAALQEVETLKVALKFKDTQIRKLMQDRSQLKDDLTAMKRPMLATVVSKFLKNSHKGNPSDKATNLGTVEASAADKTKETAVAGKPHALLTSESKEDLRRMLDGYFSLPSPAAGVSSDDTGPSRTTKLHIVLPKDDGYLQEATDDQSSRNFFSLLESKEFQHEAAGQTVSQLNGVKPSAGMASHLISAGEYFKAGVDATPSRVIDTQQIQGYDAPSDSAQIRRHNQRWQSGSKKHVISDARNKMRLYFERHFAQQQMRRMEIAVRNSTMGDDVTDAQSDVRATHDDVAAGRKNASVAKRVGHGDGVVDKSSMKNDVIGAKGGHREAERLLGTSSGITVSQTTEAIKLRHDDVTAADSRKLSSDGVFHCVRRSSGTRLDCDILKAMHVTSRHCCDGQTAIATSRWPSFGVSGRLRAPTDTKCLNCMSVEKFARSRAGLRSAEVICDEHHQQNCPLHIRNYTTTYAWLPPDRTYASDLLQIKRLDKK